MLVQGQKAVNIPISLDTTQLSGIIISGTTTGHIKFDITWNGTTPTNRITNIRFQQGSISVSCADGTMKLVNLTQPT